MAAIVFYDVVENNEGLTVSIFDKVDDERKKHAPQLPASVRQPSSTGAIHGVIHRCDQGEEARANFKQQALTSWAAYQRTGRHLTDSEVRSWLSSWGTDEEAVLFECHS